MIGWLLCHVGLHKHADVRMRETRGYSWCGCDRTVWVFDWTCARCGKRGVTL